MRPINRKNFLRKRVHTSGSVTRNKDFTISHTVRGVPGARAESVVAAGGAWAARRTYAPAPARKRTSLRRRRATAAIYSGDLARQMKLRKPLATCRLAAEPLWLLPWAPLAQLRRAVSPTASRSRLTHKQSLTLFSTHATKRAGDGDGQGVLLYLATMRNLCRPLPKVASSGGFVMKRTGCNCPHPHVYPNRTRKNPVEG